MVQRSSLQYHTCHQGQAMRGSTGGRPRILLSRRLRHRTRILRGVASLIVWLYGLVSLRRNDPWVLRAGGFNAKLAPAQVQKPPSQQFISYGDGAYPDMPHVTSALGPVAVDKAMSSVRELIEHLFGESDSYFPYMADKKNHHLMSSQALKELYFSVQLLRNCYTCLCHDKTSTRLKCPPPSLEEYLSWV